MNESIINRKSKISFRINEDEKAIIQKRFELSGQKRLSDYLRLISMNGYILTFDKNEIDKMRSGIANISNNINQIARRINSTGNIYSEDITELKEKIDELWQLQVYIQSTLRKLNP